MEPKRSNIPPHGILRTCTYLPRRKSSARWAFMSIFLIDREICAPWRGWAEGAARLRSPASGLTAGRAKRQRGRGARHSVGAGGPSGVRVEVPRLVVEFGSTRSNRGRPPGRRPCGPVIDQSFSVLCVSSLDPPKREFHERRSSRQALGYTESVCRLVAGARPRADRDACEDHGLGTDRRSARTARHDVGSSRVPEEAVLLAHAEEAHAQPDPCASASRRGAPATAVSALR